MYHNGLKDVMQLDSLFELWKVDSEIDRSEFPNVTQGKWTQEDQDAGLGTKGEWKQSMSLGKTGVTQIGLIAQELEAVLPDCVTTDIRGVRVEK